MSIPAPDEISMEDPLCDSSLGSMVTLDYVTPLTFPKQWNAWQEKAAATVIPPAEAKIIWRTLRKQGLQDRVVQTRFLVEKNKGDSTAENRLDIQALVRIVVLGHADPDVLDIRKDSPTACREAINVLLAIFASKKRESGL